MRMDTEICVTFVIANGEQMTMSRMFNGLIPAYEKFYFRPSKSESLSAADRTRTMFRMFVIDDEPGLRATICYRTPEWGRAGAEQIIETLKDQGWEPLTPPFS